MFALSSVAATILDPRRTALPLVRVSPGPAPPAPCYRAWSKPRVCSRSRWTTTGPLRGSAWPPRNRPGRVHKSPRARPPSSPPLVAHVSGELEAFLKRVVARLASPCCMAAEADPATTCPRPYLSPAAGTGPRPPRTSVLSVRDCPYRSTCWPAPRAPAPSVVR